MLLPRAARAEDLLRLPAEKGLPANIADLGTCGDGVTWTLYGSGKLVIAGDGPIDNYSYTSVDRTRVTTAPWGKYELRHILTSLEIADEVWDIGNYAFYGCTGFDGDIVLSEKLAEIGPNTFAGMTHCSGTVTVPAWTETIDPGAFTDTRVKTVYCYSDTYGEEWAVGRGCGDIRFLDDFTEGWPDDRYYWKPVYPDIDFEEKLDLSNDGAEEENPDWLMAHNIYNDPYLSATSGKFSGFSIDLKADLFGKNTYWSLCNFKMDYTWMRQHGHWITEGGAYCGLQHRGSDTAAIMAFWDMQIDGETVTPVLEYPVKEGNGRFGNEGSDYRTGEDEYVTLAPDEYSLTVSCADERMSECIQMEQPDASGDPWRNCWRLYLTGLTPDDAGQYPVMITVHGLEGDGRGDRVFCCMVYLYNADEIRGLAEIDPDTVTDRAIIVHEGETVTVPKPRVRGGDDWFEWWVNYVPDQGLFDVWEDRDENDEEVLVISGRTAGTDRLFLYPGTHGYDIFAGETYYLPVVILPEDTEYDNDDSWQLRENDYRSAILPDRVTGDHELWLEDFGTLEYRNDEEGIEQVTAGHYTVTASCSDENIDGHILVEDPEAGGGVWRVWLTGLTAEDGGRYTVAITVHGQDGKGDRTVYRTAELIPENEVWGAAWLDTNDFDWGTLYLHAGETAHFRLPEVVGGDKRVFWRLMTDINIDSWDQMDYYMSFTQFDDDPEPYWYMVVNGIEPGMYEFSAWVCAAGYEGAVEAFRSIIVLAPGETVADDGSWTMWDQRLTLMYNGDGESEETLCIDGLGSFEYFPKAENGSNCRLICTMYPSCVTTRTSTPGSRRGSTPAIRMPRGVSSN